MQVPLPIYLTDAFMEAVNEREFSDTGWWTVAASPPQIVPAQDIRAHTFGARCKCRPVDDGEIVVHNAYDGRETAARREKARNH